MFVGDYLQWEWDDIMAVVWQWVHGGISTNLLTNYLHASITFIKIMQTFMNIFEHVQSISVSAQAPTTFLCPSLSLSIYISSLHSAPVPTPKP